MKKIEDENLYVDLKTINEHSGKAIVTKVIRDECENNNKSCFLFKNGCPIIKGLQYIKDKFKK